MPRGIIIGYDGLGHSEDALTLGGLLAEALSAVPVVVAVEYLPQWLVGSEGVEALLRRRTDPIFEAARQRLAPLEAERVRSGARPPRTRFTTSPRRKSR
jgi:hypothetical protein